MCVCVWGGGGGGGGANHLLEAFCIENKLKKGGGGGLDLPLTGENLIVSDIQNLNCMSNHNCACMQDCANYCPWGEGITSLVHNVWRAVMFTN